MECDSIYCDSKFTIAKGEVIRCIQHLGPPSRTKHSARHMGFRVYWTDEEADK